MVHITCRHICPLISITSSIIFCQLYRESCFSYFLSSRSWYPVETISWIVYHFSSVGFCFDSHIPRYIPSKPSCIEVHNNILRRRMRLFYLFYIDNNRLQTNSCIITTPHCKISRRSSSPYWHILRGEPTSTISCTISYRRSNFSCNIQIGTIITSKIETIYKVVSICPYYPICFFITSTFGNGFIKTSRTY